VRYADTKKGDLFYREDLSLFTNRSAAQPQANTVGKRNIALLYRILVAVKGIFRQSLKSCFKQFFGAQKAGGASAAGGCNYNGSVDAKAKLLKIRAVFEEKRKRRGKL
jgi:hypothetical protein